jgi:membrane-bound ClpP family serine protease
MEASYLALGLALIAAGFLLLVAELFIPSYGLITVLALSSIVGGVILIFLHDTTAGVYALVGVFIALPVVAWGLMYIWPHTPIGRLFVLQSPAEDATVASMSSHQELNELKGRIGRALSALRPAGVVDFDGRRIDTITEGMMVEAGQWVRCVEVRAGKVVVRPVDRPDFELEKDIFS